jgi:hypothetical protein
MASANPPRDGMADIVVARYALLVLPQPLNNLPAEGYLKELPKFTREERINAEEHLASFYIFANNLDISNQDV